MRIAVLPGDGIGPEVTAQAVGVLRTIADLNGHDFEFTDQPIAGVAIQRYGSPLPQATLDACLTSDAVIFGAVGSPEFDHLPPSDRPEAALLRLRRELGGYANLRPAVGHAALDGVSPLKSAVVQGADVLVVRELLGGLYFSEPRGRSGTIGNSVATNTMSYSTGEIERVAHVAFQIAQTRRQKVTSVDKANVLETSQLWRETVSRIGLEYPDVTLEHVYVDACAMYLITNPKRFDVILTENLFGDILSDESAAIAGSLGMLASATIGGTVDLYEPVHGSAPDIAGRGVANPLGAIASAAMLLRHSAGLETDACIVEDAIVSVLEQGFRTPDIASREDLKICTTTEIGALVCNAVIDIADERHAYHAV